MHQIARELVTRRLQPSRLIAGSLHLTGDRGMKGRCPVHQEDMAGRRLVACLSLRWLRASCAVASAVLRPAGRAERVGYFGALDATRELDRGRAGRGLVRAGSAAAGPAFRFVLVSVLRGQCPWLSVRSGGWEPAGTDIWRTVSLRQTSSSGIYAGQRPYEGAGRSGLTKK